jgi:hypothetical protein
MPLNKGYPTKNTIMTPKVSHHTLHSPTHEPIHHVLKDDLGEVKCMLNFKNLVGAQISKFFEPLFMGTKAFMHATKKGDAFFFMHFYYKCWITAT